MGWYFRDLCLALFLRRRLTASVLMSLPRFLGTNAGTAGTIPSGGIEYYSACRGRRRRAGKRKQTSFVSYNSLPPQDSQDSSAGTSEISSLGVRIRYQILVYNFSIVFPLIWFHLFNIFFPLGYRIKQISKLIHFGGLMIWSLVALGLAMFAAHGVWKIFRNVGCST